MGNHSTENWYFAQKVTIRGLPLLPHGSLDDVAFLTPTAATPEWAIAVEKHQLQLGHTVSWATGTGLAASVCVGIHTARKTSANCVAFAAANTSKLSTGTRVGFDLIKLASGQVYDASSGAPTGGTFNLTVGYQTSSTGAPTTAPVTSQPYSCVASALQTAINSALSLGGQVVVTGALSTGMSIAYTGTTVQSCPQVLVTVAPSLTGGTNASMLGYSQVVGAAPLAATNYRYNIALATTGTFLVAVDGVATATMSPTISGSTIAATLEALSTVGSGNVGVTSAPNSTSSPTSYAVTLEFISAMATTNAPETVQVAGSALTGTTKAGTTGLHAESAGVGSLITSTGGAQARGLTRLLVLNPTVTTGTWSFVNDDSGHEYTSAPLAFNASNETIHNVLATLSYFYGGVDVTPGYAYYEVCGGPLPTYPVIIVCHGSTFPANVLLNNSMVGDAWFDSNSYQTWPGLDSQAGVNEIQGLVITHDNPKSILTTPVWIDPTDAPYTVKSGSVSPTLSTMAPTDRLCIVAMPYGDTLLTSSFGATARITEDSL